MAQVKGDAYKVTEQGYFVTDFKSSFFITDVSGSVIHYGWSPIPILEEQPKVKTEEGSKEHPDIGLLKNAFLKNICT